MKNHIESHFEDEFASQKKGIRELSRQTNGQVFVDVNDTVGFGLDLIVKEEFRDKGFPPSVDQIHFCSDIIHFTEFKNQADVKPVALITKYLSSLNVLVELILRYPNKYLPIENPKNEFLMTPKRLVLVYNPLKNDPEELRRPLAAIIIEEKKHAQALGAKKEFKLLNKFLVDSVEFLGKSTYIEEIKNATSTGQIVNDLF